MRKTGKIWSKSLEERARIVREICKALERAYGRPRLGNPEAPLDALIYIIVSNKTVPDMAKQTYARIKDKFPIWDDLLSAPQRDLYSTIEPAGLATVKSRQIRAAIREVKEDYGKCDLDLLAEKPTDEIHEYLVRLPGVSDKVAKCVMLFTMGKNVLPVDSHVHRIAKRLGWTSRKRADQCHDELEALVPPKRRYAFHVDCILHGRTVCRPRNPVCDECCISHHCAYYRSQEETCQTRKDR